MCGAPSDESVVVVLSAGDLGLEDLVELGGEFGMGGDVEGDFASIRDPVEVAPDFAAEEGCGLLVFGKSAEGGDGSGKDGEVSGVFVGGVVSVDGLGSGLCEEGDELVSELALAGGAFEVRGGVGELELGGVLTEIGGLNLFAVAEFFDVGIGVVGEGAGARGAASVGAGDTGEPVTRFLVAGDDAVIGHELEVVLMSANAEVGGAREGFGEVFVVRDVRRHEGMGWQTFL